MRDGVQVCPAMLSSVTTVRRLTPPLPAPASYESGELSTVLPGLPVLARSTPPPSTFVFTPMVGTSGRVKATRN